MRTYPNTLTNEFLSNLTLNTWVDYTVRVDIEEPAESISDLIIYENHGDEYAIVHSADKWYRYGCYFNFSGSHRRDFDHLMRRPEEFAKYDDNATCINRIYRVIEDTIMSHIKYDLTTEQYVSDISSDYAQRCFNMAVKAFADGYESGFYYNLDSRQGDLMREFLIANHIDTPENLAILDTVHFNSKRDGLDGICGKDDISENRVLGIEDVRVWYHNGRNMKVDFSTRHLDLDNDDVRTDDWGMDTWWASPEECIAKLSLMSDVHAFDLSIAARNNVVLEIRSKIEALECELERAVGKLQEVIREAEELDPDHEYEIFHDKVVVREKGVL